MSTRGFLATGLALVMSTTLLAATAGAATASGSQPTVAALSRAQAVALVKTGVAQKKDVPAGFRTQARSLDQRKKDLAIFRSDEAAFYKCLGSAQPAYVARGFGPKFATKGNKAEIVTTADVTSSVKAARRVMTIHHDERGPRCYQMRLANALRRNNLTGDVVVRQVGFAVPRADETFAYRTTLTVRGPQGVSTAEALLVGSRVGAVLTTVSFSLGRGQEIAGKTIQKTAAKPLARVKKELARQANRGR